ncbi:hypothetical protein C8F04DRAFT_1267120 [Mycena alexandri]|uniref:Uncharacterized protein n=1 Tax=Mycena alexandri TaxID=1745969 RepID=A0AAD6SHR6_9AGAR|nr:hypothetical protein C8F04DRAFT_1267120 [Mycena alexandri]
MSYSRATAGKASPNQDLPPFACKYRPTKCAHTRPASTNCLIVVDAIGVPASLHRDAPHQVGVANSQTFTTSAVHDSSIGVVEQKKAIQLAGHMEAGGGSRKWAYAGNLLRSAKFWHGVFEQVRAYPGIGGFRWASSPLPPLLCTHADPLPPAPTHLLHAHLRRAFCRRRFRRARPLSTTDPVNYVSNYTVGLSSPLPSFRFPTSALICDFG